MAESKVECFSGVKTAQNSKMEDGIENKKQKCMLLQNEVNVKFEVQTPYKKKTADAINFESVTCYLGRPR